MSIDRSALLVGLPGTGKTSYLAILFLAIMEERACSIRLAEFDDDRVYINQVSQALIQCRKANRTETSESSGLGMAIILPSGESARLLIPDYSGETWHAALEERSISAELAAQIVDATSVMLFVHVDEFTNDPPIFELNAIESALDADIATADEPHEMEPEDGTNIESSQVQLIDLLQVVAAFRRASAGRVSIVLSAFDCVIGQTPSEWIETSAPLLHQFLVTNKSRLEVDVYGLSAQGGEFGDDAAKDSLIERDPVERAFMVSANGKQVDFDSPFLRAFDDV